MRSVTTKQKPSQRTKSVKAVKPDRASPEQHSEHRSVLKLQRTIGNQAVTRLLQRGQEELAGEEKAERSSTAVAEPVSNGSLEMPEAPMGEFNEEEADALTAPPVSAEEDMETEESTATAPVPEGQDAAQPAPAAPVAPAPQPAQAAPAARTVIRGPREMWNFDGETPPNYLVSSPLSTNKRGGAFRWSVSANLSLSSAAVPRPVVTTVAPSVPPGRDATIRIRHTDAAGTATAASYRLTILAPESLTHLRNVDRAVAGLGYESEVHYSIHDQLGTVLPRNVPLNEEFTGPAIQDFPGGNWTRPPACGAAGVCGASFNPADWSDRVTGEGDAGAIPAPVGPAHPSAAVAAEHWPGDWFIGSSVIGDGRRVSTITWQRNRGFARHT